MGILDEVFTQGQLGLIDRFDDEDVSNAHVNRRLIATLSHTLRETLLHPSSKGEGKEPSILDLVVDDLVIGFIRVTANDVQTTFKPWTFYEAVLNFNRYLKGEEGINTGPPQQQGGPVQTATFTIHRPIQNLVRFKSDVQTERFQRLLCECLEKKFDEFWEGNPPSAPTFEEKFGPDWLPTYESQRKAIISQGKCFDNRNDLEIEELLSPDSSVFLGDVKEIVRKWIRECVCSEPLRSIVLEGGVCVPGKSRPDTLGTMTDWLTRLSKEPEAEHAIKRLLGHATSTAADAASVEALTPLVDGLLESVADATGPADADSGAQGNEDVGKTVDVALSSLADVFEEWHEESKSNKHSATPGSALVRSLLKLVYQSVRANVKRNVTTVYGLFGKKKKKKSSETASRRSARKKLIESAPKKTKPKCDKGKCHRRDKCDEGLICFGDDGWYQMNYDGQKAASRKE